MAIRNYLKNYLRFKFKYDNYSACTCYNFIITLTVARLIKFNFCENCYFVSTKWVKGFLIETIFENRESPACEFEGEYECDLRIQRTISLHVNGVLPSDIFAIFSIITVDWRSRVNHLFRLLCEINAEIRFWYPMLKKPFVKQPVIKIYL